MVRKFVSATVSAALCIATVAPAAAQSYRAGGPQAPMGATAALNLRVPLGASRKPIEERVTYGVTMGYGKRFASPTHDGRYLVRSVSLGDFRLNGNGDLRTARLASFDLADPARNKRLNLAGEGNTLWIVVGLVAAGVAVCLIADCFEGDDKSSSSS